MLRRLRAHRVLGLLLAAFGPLALAIGTTPACGGAVDAPDGAPDCSRYPYCGEGYHAEAGAEGGGVHCEGDTRDQAEQTCVERAWCFVCPVLDLPEACGTRWQCVEAPYTGSAGQGCKPAATPACGDAGADCGYAQPSNDPRCPGAYDHAQCFGACPAAGIVCSYPGAGDGTGNGCYATAVMSCVAHDGGAPSWTCAQ